MKEKRFKTYESRWSNGKVHRYLYSYENRWWYVACRGPEKTDPQGSVLDELIKVTCKKCATS